MTIRVIKINHNAIQLPQGAKVLKAAEYQVIAQLNSVLDIARERADSIIEQARKTFEKEKLRGFEERHVSRYMSISLRCFVFDFSLLDAVVFRVQPHIADWLPVSRSSTPSFRISLLRRQVDCIAFHQNRSLHASVTLCRGHKLNPAVAMLFVVPMDKSTNPLTRGIQALKWLRREGRCVFHRAEQTF